MTTIGSRIIKQINSLQDRVDDLKLATLETLLEVYFKNIIPEDNYIPETSSRYLSLMEFFKKINKGEIDYDPDWFDLQRNSIKITREQLSQDLSVAQADFNNFIYHCMLPKNYNELLKIIEIIESIADINLHNNGAKESFVAINELLKTHLDSKHVHESIKAYTKNPHEDKRDLTTTLMMLLSGGDKKNVYYINDIELVEEPEDITETITPFDLDAEDTSIEELIPPMTNTLTISEPKSKTPSPDPESGARKMTITPIVFLFASRKTSVTPLVSTEQGIQTFPPKMSPILSPRRDSKTELIKTHAIKNSF